MKNDYLNTLNQINNLDLDFEELNINIYDNSFLYNDHQN